MPVPPITNVSKTSLSEFARQIDLPSVRSPLFQQWNAARKNLSDLMWDIHSANTYYHYQASKGINSAPPIARTGLFDQGRLNAEDTESLFRLFQDCPVIPYSADDFRDGYSFDPTGSLESYNTYRRMTAAFESKLSEVLCKIAPAAEEICGHYIRIVSSHIWSLNAGPHRYQWHLDWWPVALKKLFIFPSGIDERRGSTAFRLKTGEEKVLQGPPGTWMIFENSGIEHKGFESLTEARPTIAISFAPSFRTDLRLLDAGANSGYPWFPIENPLVGAEYQGSDYFSPENVNNRILKSILELAGLGSLLTPEGMVHGSVDPNIAGNAFATLKVAAPSFRRRLERKLRRLFSQ